LLVDIGSDYELCFRCPLKAAVWGTPKTKTIQTFNTPAITRVSHLVRWEILLVVAEICTFKCAAHFRIISPNTLELLSYLNSKDKSVGKKLSNLQITTSHFGSASKRAVVQWTQFFCLVDRSAVLKSCQKLLLFLKTERWVRG
jgi:hypothetical protein